MELFGLTITRTKATTGQLASVESRGGWWPLISESWAGAWQSNITIELANVLTHPTVFACVTLIASDVAKMRLRLVSYDAGEDIWTPTTNAAFSPVLRKPNHYQTQFQFLEQWIISKLTNGNAYALKERDARGVVTGLYLLDPQRVKVLVAPDGSVYYELKRDDLSHQPQGTITVPAREMIHDPMNTLYHPLVGISPIHANGLAAVLGLKIMTNSANFFTNGSNPGGILTAPGLISDDTAARLKTYWDTNYTGDNVGKVAVLGDGLKYEPMMIPADKSQLTEQWNATSVAIAQAFHVPQHLVGGPPPPYNNIQALTVQYFTQCLQALTTQLEQALDDGLGLGPEFGNPYGVEFAVDDLLWMDSQTQMSVSAAGVGGGIFTPNEARRRFNLTPAVGGDTPYLQQQNYSLAALSRRDTAEPEPAPEPPAPPDVANPQDEPGTEELDMAKFTAALLHKVTRFDYAA